MTSELISTTWLHEHLPDYRVRIFDCRWVLGQLGEGRRQYDKAHIQGSFHLDVDTQLSASEGPGRHPIPQKRDFEKLMSDCGVSRDLHVVVYDEGKGAPAARLWWLLKYFGHEKVSVLDGGWQAWVKEGRPVTNEAPYATRGDFVARAKRSMVVDKATVESLRDDPNILLLDARAPERYRGEVEPIDKQAGHIPGAENLPFTQTLDTETGKFLSPEKIKEIFQKLSTQGAKQVICYCGSGVTACTDILALQTAGIKAQLYEGSWSEWSQDPNLPISRK